MRQTIVVGVLSTAADLTKHIHTRPGLHYARSVLIMDANPEDSLPPVGRGRPVAAHEPGSVHLDRLAVCWGTDAAVRDAVLASSRPCVVAVVRGRNDKAKTALTTLAECGREVHLLSMRDGGAYRIVGSDAGRAVVQRSSADGWEVVETRIECFIECQTDSSDENPPSEPSMVLNIHTSDEASVDADAEVDDASAGE